MLPACAVDIKKLDGGKDRKEKTMKKKHGVFFGFAVLLIAAMFTLAGCGDNGDPTSPGGGGTQTGAVVGVPTLASKTANSITINAVAAPSNGQTVEYAKNTTNTAPASGWQDGLTFSGLTASTQYYIFARSKANATYKAGAASTGLSVTTDSSGGGGTGNWPNSTILAEYGLSGMTVPAGATNITHSVATVGGHSLTINFTGSSASDTPVKNGFTSSGWTEDDDASYEDFIAIFYTKAGFLQGSYTRNGTSCQIQSAKN
jgi:hypothetical protein